MHQVHLTQIIFQPLLVMYCLAIECSQKMGDLLFGHLYLRYLVNLGLSHISVEYLLDTNSVVGKKKNKLKNIFAVQPEAGRLF